VTNFITIALSATLMARFYGFGHHLSRRQSWTQTLLLILVFIVMAIPLGISLNRIGREAVAVSQTRTLLNERFGEEARVTQLDLDFAADPLIVRAVVIAPRGAMQKTPALQSALTERLGRPIRLDLDQILLEPGAGALEAQREELRQASDFAKLEAQHGADLARLVGLITGVPADDVTIDRDHHRVIASASPLPEAGLETYRMLEGRAEAQAEGWTVSVVPPQSALPVIGFADNVDTLDKAASAAVATSIWAAKRWNITALGVPGLPPGEVPTRPNLSQRRALAIASALRAGGITPLPLPASGQRFSLTPGTATAS
jgi:hypothetical protein